MPGDAAPARLVELLLSNPFSLASDELDRAAAELAACAPAQAERWAERAAAQAPLRHAPLALLHARALVEELRGITPTKSGARPSAVQAGAARVALASARCTARLRRLAGSSAALARLRHDCWAACFGRSLVHGLALERLVRGHDVLISGETGVGKEQVAYAIAAGTPGQSRDGSAPVAELNAAAVPETLVESELFGHAKGAFTGAHEARKGLVRSADGGCLFLDEVGDLPLLAQAKLLRVIETDRVQPLGTEQVHAVDVRFLAATHHDLRARAEQGLFRPDLYQRLAAVVIRVPALRERPEDIAPIGEHFLEEAARGAPFALDTDAIRRWLRGAEARAYGWPGNVRELRNVVGNLLLGLPMGLAQQGTSATPGPTLPEAMTRGEAPLAELEQWYLAHVLQRCGGNVAHAARVLAIDRTTLARKLRRKGKA